MISVEQLTVDFGGSPLFDEISFLVNAKDRIALVGKNGAGQNHAFTYFCRKTIAYQRENNHTERPDHWLSASTHDS